MLMSAEFATANIEMIGMIVVMGRSGAARCTTSTRGGSDRGGGKRRLSRGGRLSLLGKPRTRCKRLANAIHVNGERALVSVVMLHANLGMRVRVRARARNAGLGLFQDDDVLRD